MQAQSSNNLKLFSGHEKLPVFAEIFPGFSEWLISVLEEVNPDVVVAIARGAIRLLQIHNAEPHVLCRATLVSHHALPFLDDSQLRSKTVLLFDDSVVFGSVMSRLRAYLTDRGARVSCASFAVSRSSFLGEKPSESSATMKPSPHSSIPILSKHRLWPSGIRRHHAQLIRAVLRSGLDYNLDFPTFRLIIPPFDPREAPYLINLMSSARDLRSIRDVSAPAFPPDNVCRYTALLNGTAWKLFDNPQLTFRPYSKLRIAVDPTLGHLRITPMLQIAATTSARFKDVSFFDDSLTKMWNTFIPPTNERDPFYPQALFRLLTCFASMIVGSGFLTDIRDAIAGEFPVHEAPLSTGDLQLVLGPENSELLLHHWRSLRSSDSLTDNSRVMATAEATLEKPNAPELRLSMRDAWRVRPELRPSKSDLVCEAVGKVFLTLRSVTDSPGQRESNPAASRLDVGLSYEAIRSTLEDECGLPLSEDDISLAIDFCVDNGLAVPKVVREDGFCFRAFYSGEDEDDQKTLQFKVALHEAYRDYLAQPKSTALTPFDMHKLCVCLKDLSPALPISTRYHTFGRFASVGRNQAELIEWLTDPDLGPLTRTELDGKTALLPKERFIPPVHPTMSPADRREFLDSFHYLAMAFARVGSEEKLLLTTCRSHRHTYNAIAFEAHSWMGRGHGFPRLVTALRSGAANGDAPHEDDLSTLYWCIQNITEARKKYTIFHKRFRGLQGRLGDAFRRNGIGSRRWWEFVQASDLLDPTEDPEIQHRLRFLMPLVGQMQSLTVFVAGGIRECRVASERDLELAFRRHRSALSHKDYSWLSSVSVSTAARRYNTAIASGGVPGVSILKTQLPDRLPTVGEPLANWWSAALETADNCLFELERTLNEYCKRYDVREGDFPYSPEGNRRVFEDGSTECRLDQVFVFTLDIMGSTDSAQTNRMKDAVLLTFKRFAQKGFYCEHTGNDAFVACCSDANVLWDVASSISLEGEHLAAEGGDFRGTRKGLSFGSVSLVRQRNGGIAIRDSQIPNLLPRAFSMLEGIDSCVEREHQNAAVIVDDASFPHLRRELRWRVEPRDPVPVHSKHFSGRCHLIFLRETSNRSAESGAEKD